MTLGTIMLRLGINLALTIDVAGNVLLLGRAGETVSRRVARLRRYGHGRAKTTGCILCRMLTRLFWFMHRDHCEWAMEAQGKVDSEIWRWSK